MSRIGLGAGFLLVGLLVTFAGCLESIPGCTDPSASNYNPLANQDDGSCMVSVPDTYQFERRGERSVLVNTIYGSHLLRDDLFLRLTTLTEPGASVVTEAELLAYYSGPIESLAEIAVSTGSFPADPTTFAGFGSILWENFARPAPYTLPAETLPAALRQIAENSRGGDLGSPSVLWDTAGRDLSVRLRTDALGLLYQRAVDLLQTIDTLDNLRIRTNPRATQAERGWDTAFAVFGAARQYRAFTDENLAALPSATALPAYAANLDEDSILRFTEEMNYGFAREAGARDLAVPAANLRERLFARFVEGRALLAAGPTDSLLVKVLADELTILWDELLAATAIHHLNRLLVEIERRGTPAFDESNFRAAWSGAEAWMRMLARSPFSKAGSTSSIQENLLRPLGDRPDSVNAPAVQAVRDALETAYGFPSDWVVGW